MQVTQHVALLSKWVAADLYAKELDLLQFELSMSRCSVDLWAAVEALQHHQAHQAAVAGALAPLKPTPSPPRPHVCDRRKWGRLPPFSGSPLLFPLQCLQFVRNNWLV